MKKIKILITAGPTREMLDPVRFLSNLSTGEMGYALAREAKRRNYFVTLISGPTMLQSPKGVRVIPILSAQELSKACAREFPKHDVLVMSAAVCDFRAVRKQTAKIQRTRTHHLELEQTPDILAGLAKRKGKRRVIGFCLETSQWIEKAKQKIKRKFLDGIVANYYTAKHCPFGKGNINTALIDRQGHVRMLRNVSKAEISKELLSWVESLQS